MTPENLRCKPHTHLRLDLPLLARVLSRLCCLILASCAKHRCVYEYFRIQHTALAKVQRSVHLREHQNTLADSELIHSHAVLHVRCSPSQSQLLDVTSVVCCIYVTLSTQRQQVVIRKFDLYLKQIRSILKRLHVSRNNLNSKTHNSNLSLRCRQTQQQRMQVGPA